MKTVLIDNSLCSYSLRDDVDPANILAYIRALAEAGVGFVEIDFRAAMRLDHLPEGIGYIFRMVDPMFIKLTEIFDFNYVLLTLADLNKDFSVSTPIMLELPLSSSVSSLSVECIQRFLGREISYLRLRGNFPLEGYDKFSEWAVALRRGFFPSVDICPLNERKTALDTALKFTYGNAESLTLTMGLPKKYCSLEEYCFTLLSMYGTLPDDIRLPALCRAGVYQQLIFKNSEGAISYLSELLDRDIHCLYNADTGERVHVAARLKDSEYIRQTYQSALERMAVSEGMPREFYENVSKAIKHFDYGIFNEELLNKKYKGLPN